MTIALKKTLFGFLVIVYDRKIMGEKFIYDLRPWKASLLCHSHLNIEAK